MKPRRGDAGARSSMAFAPGGVKGRNEERHRCLGATKSHSMLEHFKMDLRGDTLEGLAIPLPCQVA